MTRVILVLFIAAVVFVVVWTFAPDVMRDLLPQAASPAAHPEESVKAETPPAAGKSVARKRSVNAPEKTSTATDSSNGVAAPVAARGGVWQPSVTPSNPGQPARPIYSVTTDTATMYSTNAVVGPVVSQLRKGEVVEAQFILNSAGQEWMFVSVADRRVSGFLRAETLAKKQADQTSR
jgi:hypothetical protein